MWTVEAARWTPGSPGAFCKLLSLRQSQVFPQPEGPADCSKEAKGHLSPGQKKNTTNWPRHTKTAKLCMPWWGIRMVRTLTHRPFCLFQEPLGPSKMSNGICAAEVPERKICSGWYLITAVKARSQCTSQIQNKMCQTVLKNSLWGLDYFCFFFIQTTEIIKENY